MSQKLGRWLVGVLVSVCLTAWADLAVAAPAVDADIPVAELDPHFKGGKAGHAYTHAMLELGMRMGAATTAALRNDPERAKAALKSFREQQGKVAAMVPSWKAYFQSALIDELASAVASKSAIATRRDLVARLEKSCTNCHAKYMFPVQARYRWGDFAAAAVQTDQGESVSFHQLMLDLANGLGAVRGEVAAGQIADARAAYDLLRERFTMMELLCTNCHEQPREYFIDARVKGRLLKLGGLLRKGETRAAEYAPLFSDINEMSCLPCHQVHMPAAFLQKYSQRAKR